jgi:hypothetical protein
VYLEVHSDFLNALYTNLESTRSRVDQGTDGKMKWVKIEEWRKVAGRSIQQRGTEEAPKNGKESSQSLQANRHEWIDI